jgi:hypothetical protein
MGKTVHAEAKGNLGAPCPKGCRAAALPEILRKIKIDIRIEVSIRR